MLDAEERVEYTHKLRKSIQDLQVKGSQIKQMENMLSMQRMLSQRSREGSLETHTILNT